MKFYSGFSLKDEEYLFSDFLTDTEYGVCGFSYGAIKAFTDVKERLSKGRRVDTLTLLSPAFFQTKPLKFKKLQLMGYKKSKEAYMKEFISLCFSPHKKKIVGSCETGIEELDELLNYEWISKELELLHQQGVKIEVYLGGKDKIIDVESAREFFLKVSTVTYIKNANHFLQTN